MLQQIYELFRISLLQGIDWLHKNDANRILYKFGLAEEGWTIEDAMTKEELRKELESTWFYQPFANETEEQLRDRLKWLRDHDSSPSTSEQRIRLKKIMQRRFNEIVTKSMVGTSKIFNMAIKDQNFRVYVITDHEDQLERVFMEKEEEIMKIPMYEAYQLFDLIKDERRSAL